MDRDNVRLITADHLRNELLKIADNIECYVPHGAYVLEGSRFAIEITYKGPSAKAEYDMLVPDDSGEE